MRNVVLRVHWRKVLSTAK